MWSIHKNVFVLLAEVSMLSTLKGELLNVLIEGQLYKGGFTISTYLL